MTEKNVHFTFAYHSLQISIGDIQALDALPPVGAEDDTDDISKETASKLRSTN